MTEQIHHTATDRARLYTLLSVAFDRPKEPLAGALEDRAIPDLLAESAKAVGNPEVAPAAAEVSAEVADADIESFRSAYADTFAIGTGSAVSPYETNYRPGGIVTNTDELADIAGFYDAFGLEVGEHRDRVDHLCTELEFVGELASREAYLAQMNDEVGVEIVVDAQRMFIDDHLGRWTPRLLAELEKTAVNDLYPSLARLLDALVLFDARRLGIERDVLEATPDGPLETLFDSDDGDWRCGTCAGNPSPNNPMRGNE